jgi:hypothetical protein
VGTVEALSPDQTPLHHAAACLLIGHLHPSHSPQQHHAPSHPTTDGVVAFGRSLSFLGQRLVAGLADLLRALLGRHASERQRLGRCLRTDRLPDLGIAFECAREYPKMTW